MGTNKFWKWKNRIISDQEGEGSVTERTLFLNGTIAEESWFDDDVTPALFKDELVSGEGDITVWINSPGGDCVAAAQIYNMPKYKKIPGTVSGGKEGSAEEANIESILTAGLMRGLRMNDTRTMTLGMWIDYIIEWNIINMPDGNTNRMATQEDFDKF